MSNWRCALFGLVCLLPAALHAQRGPSQVLITGIVELSLTPKSTMAIVSVDQDPPDGNVDSGVLMEISPNSTLPKPFKQRGTFEYLTNRYLRLSSGTNFELTFSIPEHAPSPAVAARGASHFRLVGITRIATAGSGGHDVFVDQFGRLLHMPNRPRR